MSWNDSIERKRFMKEQEKQAAQYRSLGMSEDQINEMFEFDFSQYKERRIHSIHTTSLNDFLFDSDDNEESNNPVYKKNLDQFSVTLEDSGSSTHLGWLEEIDNPLLVEKLKLLSESDLELVTLIANDGFNQTEIAARYGTTPQAISKKYTELKKI